MNTVELIYVLANQSAIWGPYASRVRTGFKAVAGAALVAVALSSTVGSASAAGFEHYDGGSFDRFDRSETLSSDPCFRNPLLCEDDLTRDQPIVAPCLCTDGSNDCCE